MSFSRTKPKPELLQRTGGLRNYSQNPQFRALTVRNIPRITALGGTLSWSPGEAIANLPSIVSIVPGPSRTLSPQLGVSDQSNQNPEVIGLPHSIQDVEVVAAEKVPNLLDFFPIAKELLTGQ